MYEGSMYGAGIAVFAVWGYAIAHVRQSRVELNPKKLADTLGGEVKDIESAIDFLTKPDPDSRHKEHDGRRLIREGQFQYFLPSWESYQQIRNAEERREYNRRKQQEYRDLQKLLEGMTPKERTVFEKNRKAEFKKRKKNVLHDGAIQGARDAVNEGLADASREAKEYHEAKESVQSRVPGD